MIDGASPNAVPISLRNWPERPINNARPRLSPKSGKIIEECGITMEEILPQTFDEYAKSNSMAIHGYEELLERFHQH